jgi:alcohol dehydrogenase
VVIGSFGVGRLPEIVFGRGAIARLPEIAVGYGRRLLLVTGASSLRSSRHWVALEDALAEHKLAWLPLTVAGEPSPDVVDAAVREHHSGFVDAVVGIGGGSVLDAAKAIAGLLPSGRSVMDHVEDVGRGLPFTGPGKPFIAVPTTAGTGSEATRNAVVSVRGTGGFKKSFRHDALFARVAIVDPDLLETCPAPLIAADGMDALTQLLEAYTSARASVFTDALAESGLAAVRAGLLAWHAGEGDVAAARASMAYAALISGIVLAQAGLGAVHGLAAPIGAFHPAPHGAVCGTLVAEATRANVKALRARAPGHTALAKYARAGVLLGARAPRRGDPADGLVKLLEAWTERLGLPRLGAWGLDEAGLGAIVAGSRGSSMKSNPIVLDDDEVAEILTRRL